MFGAESDFEVHLPPSRSFFELLIPLEIPETIEIGYYDPRGGKSIGDGEKLMLFLGISTSKLPKITYSHVNLKTLKKFC